MKKRTVDELASAMAAAEKKSIARDARVYPFTQAAFGTTSVVRFLPDANEENSLLWAERRDIHIPFLGVVNNGDYDSFDVQTVSVPCLETWGEVDPISTAMKPYWKGGDEERNFARAYYRQPQYLFTALVISSPIVEPPVESPVRILKLNKSLMERVRLGVNQAEYKWSPADFDEGRDFRLIKTQRGEWANWEQSGFSINSRALSEAERAAIQQHGLIDLGSLIGPPPDVVTRTAIKAMFQDSLAGKPFDAAAYPGFKAWPSRKPMPHLTETPVIPQRVKDETLQTLAGMRQKVRVVAATE